MPDYVVVAVGTNDLIQLISPKDTADSSVPTTSGDCTGGGVFTDSDGVRSADHTVPPIMDRLESLLDDIVAEFPSSTKIISRGMSPVDTAAKGSRFVFLDPALALADIVDGIHPTTGGYEKVGITIGDFINGNKKTALDLIGPQSVVKLSTLTFTATATDGDGDDLTFSLSNDAPVGAAIDEDTGVFTWTPTSGQGPVIYMFEVIVTDDGDGFGSDSELITVEVTGSDPYEEWLAANFSAGDLTILVKKQRCGDAK